MKQKITCPETGHLEEIEVEVDPVNGHVVSVPSCSRWKSDHVDCIRLCAHRMNQRLAKAAPCDNCKLPEAGGPGVPLDSAAPSDDNR